MVKLIPLFYFRRARLGRKYLSNKQTSDLQCYTYNISAVLLEPPPKERPSQSKIIVLTFRKGRKCYEYILEPRILESWTGVYSGKYAEEIYKQNCK